MVKARAFDEAIATQWVRQALQRVSGAACPCEPRCGMREHVQVTSCESAVGSRFARQKSFIMVRTAVVDAEQELHLCSEVCIELAGILESYILLSTSALASVFEVNEWRVKRS